ncbi:MAG: ATP-binding protein [Pseudomonadota bacterium]|nr:ATP-binding protein [Pseudomonadota bacterium]
MQVGTLIFFSGKMGAGKSTKSKQISQERNAVLISEDEWLSKLYPNQITSFDDYIHYSSLLKPLVKSHVLDILKTGTSVVMDFPANTVKQRMWFKELITEANAPNELIYLNVSNDICLRQIEKRHLEQPERAIYDTESMFIEVTKYFQEPYQSEGFNLQVVNRNA